MDRTAIYFGFRSATTSPPTMVGAKNSSAAGVRFGVEDLALYVTFRLNFHHFDCFELDLRKHSHVRDHSHVRGATFSCPR